MNTIARNFYLHIKKSIKALAITGVVIVGIAAICIIIIALTINDFRKEYRASENSIDTILNELQYKKIIALGEHHNRVNEQLFLADNIQALYNAGVRYIFIEGGPFIDEGYMFIMFYPWMYAGWRYESITMYQAIDNFNNTLQSDDIIKIISPEKTPPGNITAAQQMN